MQSKLLILAPVLLLLAAPIAAQAHTPALDLARANHAAAMWADDTVADNADSETYSDDGETVLGTVSIARYDLASCDQDGSTRATCDITYVWTDGDQCDATIIVQTTRRNRLHTRESEWTCDSDA